MTESGPESTDPKITVPCPKCGELLVIRRVKQTGERFLGCAKWPKCTYTEPLPAYYAMLESGASMLPGFEP